MSRAPGKPRRLTPIDWVICGVACIGFAFDTYELLVLTVTVQPVGSSRVDLQACKLEYSIVSPK